MIALIRKELRELTLPAVALVLCALVMTSMDLLYNRLYPQYKGQGIALMIWLVISIAVAFLGGGAAIARESRQRLIFLTSWPQSRLTLWLVKAVVSFVVTMAVIAAGFGLCLAGVQLGHYTQPSDIAEVTGTLLQILPLCFVLGLLWSGLIGSVLGAAALGFVTGAVIIIGGGYLFAFYLPTRWGPYVGNMVLGRGQGDAVLWAGLIVALFVGAWAFIRVPMLDLRRRVGLAMSLLLGMLLLASLLFLAVNAIAGRPSLQRQVTEAGLSQDGKTLYFRTASGRTERPRPRSARQSSGLWVMDMAEQKPCLICRADGAMERSDDCLILQSGVPGRDTARWTYNLILRKLGRLPGYLISVSPDGRYCAALEQESPVIRDRGGRIVQALGGETWSVVFSPNSQFAYYERKDRGLVRLDLRTGVEQVMLPSAQQVMSLSISPDGKFMTGVTRQANKQPYHAFLLNLRTGAHQDLVRVRPSGSPFVTNRLLWLFEPASMTHQTAARVIMDVETMQVVHRIPNSMVGGEQYRPWHLEGVPYVVFATYPRHSGPTAPGSPSESRRLYLASPDGSGLRFLREDKRELLGMAPDGQLIIWDHARTFLAYNPLTGAEQAILRLPEAR